MKKLKKHSSVLLIVAASIAVIGLGYIIVDSYDHTSVQQSESQL